MASRAELVLIGGGGHCKSCIAVLEAAGTFRIAGIVDVPEKLRQRVLGYEIFACDADIPALVPQYRYMLITLGQIKSAQKRQATFEYLKELGVVLPAIIAPSAYVSAHASIAEGTIIMHQAFVNAGAQVGKNCIINTRALIEHDARIGDHCHISTNSVINGDCQVGARSFVGSQSVIKNTVSIASDTVVGAGAVVIESIMEPGVYVGNPARKVR